MSDAAQQRKFDVGGILAETLDILRRNWLWCLIGCVALGLAHLCAYFALEHWWTGRTPVQILDLTPLFALPAYYLVHYFVITRVMQGERLTEFGWSIKALAIYLHASLLVLLGMIVGMILLIVPGLIAALHWAAVSGFVIAKRQSATEAMISSWRATEGPLGTIFGVSTLLGIANSVVNYLVGYSVGYAGLVGSVVGEFAIGLSSGLGGVILLAQGVAIYALFVGPNHDALQEVFA